MARLPEASPGLGAHPIASRVVEAGGLELIDTVSASDRGSWPIPRADPGRSDRRPPLLKEGYYL